MPIIRKFTSNDTDILLWQLRETSDELRGIITLTDKESDYLQKLQREKRRAEWLCWHLMVHNYFGDEGVDISYDTSGRPILNPELNKQISVSHGGNIVGVIISNQNCGIDIESVSRDFSRVEKRFMSENETNILSPFADIAKPAAIGWCAKECAFKVAQRDGIDFLNDFIITSSDRKDSSLIIESPFCNPIKIVVDIIDNHIICYSSR